MGDRVWRRRGVTTIMLALAPWSASASASAQSLAPTRDELTRPQPTPNEAPPKLRVEGDVERAPCALADPQFADIRVTIREVEFNNLKGATPAEMRSTWKDFAGRELPVSSICEVRDRAATLLREKGYLAAVQVPVQRIENGVVRLEVLYGRVTAIRARGETRGAEAKLRGYLERLTRDEIFDRNRAERYLLLARDLPGYNVQLTLRPAGTVPGELTGEVTVVRRPYSVDITMQNLSARETGRWSGQVRGQLFGLTGLGDATSVSYSNTIGGWREQRIAQVAHQFRPGSSGLTVNGQFTAAWTRPDIGGNPDDPDLKARTIIATFSMGLPVVRSQARNLFVAGGFDLVNQRVELIVPLSSDRLRIAWLRTDFSMLDTAGGSPLWQLGGSIELRRGLDVFDASAGCRKIDCSDPEVVAPSRIDGKPTATVVRGTLSAELALAPNLSLFFAPRAQKGFAPLLSFEEFTAGNFTVGRGYDPGTVLGDSGVGFNAELRGSRLQPLSRSPLRLQPYAFLDGAWIWDQNDGRSRAERLYSVGGGVRGELTDIIRLDATLAKPLRKAGPFDDKPGFRGLLTLTVRILPWR